MDEVLYAMSNPERSIEDAAASYGVSREILLRFLFAAPNGRELAWLALAPGPNWWGCEFIDMNEIPLNGFSTEDVASSWFDGGDSPYDWDFTFIQEFAIYVEKNESLVPDRHLGEMAIAAMCKMRSVSKELFYKRTSKYRYSKLKDRPQSFDDTCWTAGNF